MGRMKIIRKEIVVVCCALSVTGQMGCSNQHKEAARASTEASKAEAAVHNEKAKILEDYRKCLNKNKSDEKTCEGYKRASDSM
jgi:hypothetical protein